MVKAASRRWARLVLTGSQFQEKRLKIKQRRRGDGLSLIVMTMAVAIWFLLVFIGFRFAATLSRHARRFSALYQDVSSSPQRCVHDHYLGHLGLIFVAAPVQFYTDRTGKETIARALSSFRSLRRSFGNRDLTFARTPDARHTCADLAKRSTHRRDRWNMVIARDWSCTSVKRHRSGNRLKPAARFHHGRQHDRFGRLYRTTPRDAFEITDFFDDKWTYSVAVHDRGVGANHAWFLLLLHRARCRPLSCRVSSACSSASSRALQEQTVINTSRMSEGPRRNRNLGSPTLVSSGSGFVLILSLVFVRRHLEVKLFPLIELRWSSRDH